MEPNQSVQSRDIKKQVSFQQHCGEAGRCLSDFSAPGPGGKTRFPGNGSMARDPETLDVGGSLKKCMDLPTERLVSKAVATGKKRIIKSNCFYSRLPCEKKYRLKVSVTPEKAGVTAIQPTSIANALSTDLRHDLLEIIER
jgi:hypothetical protein